MTILVDCGPDCSILLDCETCGWHASFGQLPELGQVTLAALSHDCTPADTQSTGEEPA